MKIYWNIDRIKKPLQNCAVAIGVFDGVHRGHQKILKTVIKQAQMLKKQSVVLTFYPHPDTIIHMTKHISPLLTSLEHRIRLFAKYNIDTVIILKFTEKLCNKKAEDFIRDIFNNKIKAKIVVVGTDWKFGKNTKGDIKTLKRFGKKLNFDVIGIKPVKVCGENCRSSAIRNLIKSGFLKKADSLLGRRFSIMGDVGHRYGMGKKLGFPTANINIHNEILPPQGVYSAMVRCMPEIKKSSNKYYNLPIYRTQSRAFYAVLSIGTRPTFAKSKKIEVEAHIFNIKKKLYGKTIEIIPIDFIRKQKKYKNEKALIKAISKDVEIVKKISAGVY